MRRITFSTLLLALAGLTGCAGADIVMKPERRAQIHDVTVVSAIGNEVTHKLYTFILHLPERYEERVDWQFDEIVEATARERLTAKQPQIAITPLKYDSEKLAEKLYKVSDKEPYVDPARIADELHSAVENSSIDTIILLTGGGRLRDDKCDFSVFVLSSTAPLIPTSVGVCMTAFVLDAKTLTVLSQTPDLQWNDYNRGGIFGPIDPAPFNTKSRLPLNAEQRDFFRLKYERALREITASLMEKSGF